MDDGARLRRLLAQVMDVRHHVVAKLALQLAGALEVEVVQVRADGGDRLVGDRQPQLRSASASASHSLRHVVNLNLGEKMYDISAEAYRSVSGLEYRSMAIAVVLKIVIDRYLPPAFRSE